MPKLTAAKKAFPKIAPSFTSRTLPFVLKASRQKNVEWLEKNRDEYLSEVVEPLQAIALHLKTRLASDAPGYHFPLRGLGRLKRIASSAERYGSPFRDYLAYTARRPSASRFDHNPSVFLFVNPGDKEGDEVLLAGGLYMPSSRQLKSIRQAIATHARPFERLFRSSAFSSRFPGGFSDERKSTRNPRGFDPDHPKLEWLKLQGYFVWRSYTRREYTGKAFGDLLVQDAKQILRLNSLLDQAIEGRWVGEAASAEKPRVIDRFEDLPEAPRRRMDF